MSIEISKGARDQIKKITARKEELYSEYATRNVQYSRRREDSRPEDLVIRPPFFRDTDRIMHSKAYSRYIDKTQVFFLVDNDHITHRVLHVQLVSKIARTIGRALGFNEDLIEAISLGHDIGHVPYGHFGESVLDKLCRDRGIGGFLHNVQSVQFLDVIENCNLTLQVLDGILCHMGEKQNDVLVPENPVDWGSFQTKIEDVRSKKKDRVPFTLEGCVVRVADTIAYLGRDLQDALEVRLIGEGDLGRFPPNCKALFGVRGFENINRTVLDILVKDVIDNSYGKRSICFSKEVAECFRDFYQFNMSNIYNNEKLAKERAKIAEMYRIQFDHFLKDLVEENTESLIYFDMMNLKWISQEYLKNANNIEIVRDYIAGMTDRYFDDVFRKTMIPDRVKWRYK